MADTLQILGTIDDFLLSLADGVTLAQGELARASVGTVPGAPRMTYTLPRVDFELRMNTRFTEDATLSSRYQDIRLARENDYHVVFQPPSAGVEGSGEISSLIKGSFVAVPVTGQEDAPVIVLTTVVKPREADSFEPVDIYVEAKNADGETVEGIEVQFNIDLDESAALTAAEGYPFSLAAGTGLSPLIVTTDANGQAATVLTVDKAQPHVSLAVSIDAAGRTELVIYPTPSIIK